MNKLIKVEIEAEIAIITIDYPPVNALGEQVVKGLMEAFKKVQADKQVNAVVLTGSGEKTFMAGADIKEFPNWLGQPDMVKYVELNHQLFNYIESLKKPTIAMLNGLTLGGGCELALSCDLRIAEEHAKLGFPEVNLGIFPGGGGTQRLPKLIGRSKAKELMYFGESINAAEALAIGLVNKVAPKGEGLALAKEWATKLSNKSLKSLNSIKEAIAYGYDHSFNEGIVKETKLFSDIFQDENASEGIHAFIEKRKPEFNKS